MSLSRLNTQHIADKVTDQLDTYRSMGLIDSSLYGKLTSFRVLLEAINEADIQIAGMVKQETQVIVFVGTGEREVFLRNGDQDSGKHYDAITISGISDEQAAVFLNESPWTQIGQIRSDYIYVHSDYPIDDSRPGKRLKLVPFSTFQAKKDDDNNFDCDFELTTNISGYVYYDPARFRLRLSETVTQDSFLTFEAYLLPEKIDYDRFGEDDFNSYPICSPEFASKAMVVQTLADLMPAGLDITANLISQADMQKSRILSRMPRNHSVLTVQPRI